MASHAAGGLGSSIRERAGSLRESLKNDNANQIGKKIMKSMKLNEFTECNICMSEFEVGCQIS